MRDIPERRCTRARRRAEGGSDRAVRERGPHAGERQEAPERVAAAGEGEEKRPPAVEQRDRDERRGLTRSDGAITTEQADPDIDERMEQARDERGGLEREHRGSLPRRGLT